jgi:heme/copper-type cytochrome/quinol oxidase subunit 2
MRFAYSRRTFFTAALFVTVTRRVLVLAEDRVLELAIHNAESPATPPVLSVRQNDQVVVRLTSDKPLHVHLHGYDIESDVAPNRVTSLRFTATATGRFPIEIHSNEPRKQPPLAYLEVRPR